MLSRDDFTEAGYLSPLQIQTAHIAIVSLASEFSCLGFSNTWHVNPAPN